MGDSRVEEGAENLVTYVESVFFLNSSESKSVVSFFGLKNSRFVVSHFSTFLSCSSKKSKKRLLKEGK